MLDKIMKEELLFIKELRKKYPNIYMGLEYTIYSFVNSIESSPNKVDFEYRFFFDNKIDNDHEHFKGKTLKGLKDKVYKNLEKYSVLLKEYEEYEKRPRKFNKED